MILNGVIALILRFLPNLITLQADYVTVVEDRPMMSVRYCLQVPFLAKTNAMRSLCDSWASYLSCAGHRLKNNRKRYSM